MYFRDYEELKAQRKVIKKAFEEGKISEEIYNQKIKELDKKIGDYEIEEQLKELGFKGAKIQNGHYIIDLSCTCSYKGVMSHEKMDFKLLGKDKKGFIYFECPKCKKHLQWNCMTGKVKVKESILVKLFEKVRHNIHTKINRLKTIKLVSIIWVLFGFLFLVLSCLHFYQSAQKVEEIEISRRPLENMGSVKILGMDIDQLTEDLAKNINEYIDRVNKSNKWMNIIAGIGYILASATAFFSFYLSIKKNEVF